MKLTQYFAVALLWAAACDGDAPLSPQPFPIITASLTGTWHATTAGTVSNFDVVLTQTPTSTASPHITGDWSGYATGCAPLNSAGCFRSGEIPSEASGRNGRLVTIELAPSSACGMMNATISGFFQTSDRITGTVTVHPCNGPDAAATLITLDRQ